MLEPILTALGGVGLFLFGMKIMTESLRDATGPGLRHVLTRFTTTPLRGALTGMGATALIQSSSATTVMTVGFVGAGLMGFEQALGVLYGANVGTTITAWIVAFLGLKLQIGLIAQPVLFVGALVMLMGRGRAARIARGVAGISLLFIGLDMMQAGAVLAADWVTPDLLPGDTLGGRLALIVIGFALVNVLQSSLAGIAITLMLLSAGSMSFAQAAALVVGLNLGTTVTALMAALGGGRAMRQTALANTLFNLGTGLLAFPLLPLVGPLLHRVVPGGDDLTALVLFHSLFNLLGAAVFLPLTPRFAALVLWLIPPEDGGLASGLDPLLLSEPEAALTAAEACATGIRTALFGAISDALSAQPDLRPLAAVPHRIPPAQDSLEAYVARIRLPEGQPALPDRLAALLHRMDHLQRLAVRVERRAPLAMIAADQRLRRPARVLAGRLHGPDAARLTRLAATIDRRALMYRQQTLRRRAESSQIQDLFDRTDAMRWLARIADHAAAIMRHTR